MPIVLALGDILIAVAAALLLWAAYQLFHDLIASLLARIPLIGGELALLTDFVIFAMEQAAMRWAKDSVKALVAIVLAPVHWIESIIAQVQNAFTQVYNTLHFLRYVVLPTLINNALSTAWGWFQQSRAFASALFAQADAYAAQLYNASIGFTRNEIALTQQYAAGLYQDGINFTRSEIALTQHYADTLYQDGIAFTRASVATVENWAASSIAAVDTALTADITALDKYIATALPAVYAYVGTAVGAVEADLTRLKTECTDNLCSNLSPLANLVNSLGGELGLAGIFALAGQLAHDPRGGAGTVVQLFSGVANDAAGMARSAAGF
jgi:hypothetical protein